MAGPLTHLPAPDRVVDALGQVGLAGVGPVARAGVEWLGVAGHLARGLDAALRAIGSSTAGAGLLVVVAAGIAAFGLFCLADAATRRA